MAADPSIISVASLSGDSVVLEAKNRYDLCAEWESTFRQRFIEDLKFANGDSENGYQWPAKTLRNRDGQDRPCLTMNIVRQHNNQITNSAKQSKSQPKILALGNGATVESAKVIQQLIRHVEHQSNAQDAYTVAREFQVDGGLGWWRLVTDYAGPDTFDQEIYIREVWDPLSVFLDPEHAIKRDCSGARYAFVFDTMVPRDQFEDAFPEYVDQGVLPPLGVSTIGDDWNERDHVMVCEYFRKVPRRDTLISFMYEGERVTIRKSKMPENVAKDVLADDLTKTRPIVVDEVEWYLIAGETIIDQTIWPGKYIPLIRCLGRQTVIEGRMDRSGHTRQMKSAQYMYNWNASNQVEFGATQGKTPWIAPARAIEEFESMWNTANTVNHAVLPYNDKDDSDTPIPPPERAQPPNFAPLYEKGMETAFNQMMMVSGQWQNQMGMMGNERTGSAIQERQEQSDTSTYHFVDEFKRSLRDTARQLIDLFPKIYDTRRVIQIQADDGTDMQMEIDPGLQQAYLQEKNHQQVVVRRIFNPAIGDYQVAPDSGPDIASKRQQTVEALTLILTQAPALTGIIGDLLMRAMDFDEAQEAAQRLRRMVPPEALGEGPSQEVQQLQQVVQGLQSALAKSLDAHGKDRVKLVGKDQMRDIDAYEAETNRMKALANMLPMDPTGVKQVVEQLVSDAVATKLLPILQANIHGISEQASDAGEGGDEPPPSAPEEPPVPGARKAPDGEWYILDPTRRTKYLRIAPLAQERTPPRGTISG